MIRPASIPRLFAAGPALADHRTAYGDLPAVDTGLITTVEQAGLTGRGGAGFPTARKMAAIGGRQPVVVGNGAEGEPLSRKDIRLLTHAPHLVLDGLQAAAAATGARTIYLYVHHDAVAAVGAALAERRAAGLDHRRVEIIEAPDRFVAGEESAAIRHIEGGPALPRDRTVPAAVSGVRGQPTLVHNVETLAHIALIARFGAPWFQSVGDPAEPGTMLITLSGAVQPAGVIEAPTGTALPDLLDQTGTSWPDGVQAVLVGGYHGSWLSATDLAGARLSRRGLAAFGATPGAGIVHILGPDECGLARTATIAGYLAAESARQCGPCRNGLPELARLFDALAYGRADDQTLRDIRRINRLVAGRGSCRHPDGTARMLASALGAFSADIELHRRGSCTAARNATALPRVAGFGHGWAPV
jgi:NADH:ubiquinone oxidoreductase subunit F (NADH-binding)